jgi:hypothetical protein
MRVSEVMRPVTALDEAATLTDVVGAIEASGCEAVPIVSSNGSSESVVGQLVSVGNDGRGVHRPPAGDR